LDAVQAGVLLGRYRGRAFLKSPFDVCLYHQLIARLRPRTVIEVGTHEGGSAVWFADALAAEDIDGRVITIDRRNPPAGEVDERVTYLRGDARALAEPLAGLAGELPHPWLVTEDSAHRYETTLAVLEFFDPLLADGDYIVIEDGIVSQLTDPRYRKFEDGPNRAVERFLGARPGAYEIDASLCDRFGFNVTWSPNGWLRKLAAND
jgi:cephalosporin hydroxylase